jgi:hypothetical protein
MESANSSLILISGLLSLVFIILNVSAFKAICNDKGWLIGWNPLAFAIISMFMWWFVIIWGYVYFKKTNDGFKAKLITLTIILPVIIIMTLVMTKKHI